MKDKTLLIILILALILFKQNIHVNVVVLNMLGYNKQKVVKKAD